jgi:ADP-sugar diphosphatase
MYLPAESNLAMAAKKTFKLHDIGKQAVEVELIRGITQKQLVGWYHFQTWKETLKFNLQLQYEEVDHPFHKDPYVLKEIRVQSVDWFGNKIGFVKLRAVIENRLGKELPGVAFLRGGSVAMLMILRPKGSRDERWVVLTEQPRVPAGSLKFVEIPAGMIDEGAKTFGGVAAKEMKEETGLTIHKSELINLTELALQRSETTERTLQRAMYPSPGGSDEYIPIFLWEKVSTPQAYSSRVPHMTCTGARPPRNCGFDGEVDWRTATRRDDYFARGPI